MCLTGSHVYRWIVQQGPALYDVWAAVRLRRHRDHRPRRIGDRGRRTNRRYVLRLFLLSPELLNRLGFGIYFGFTGKASRIFKRNNRTNAPALENSEVPVAVRAQLNKVYQMNSKCTPLKSFVVLLTLLSAATASAQNILATGTLKSETGAPISDAKILFDLGNYGLKKAESKIVEATSDSQGKFALNIELDDMRDYMGEGHIWFFASGYQTQIARLNTLSDEPQRFELVLKKASGIEFTVLSPDGKPVVGAEITPWYAKMLTGNYNFPPEPVLRAVVEKTDENGKATLKHFPAERIDSVSIKTDEYGDQKHSISEAQIESQSATIGMEEVGDVKIRFTGGSGKYPLAKIGIYQHSSDRGYSSPVVTTNLDKPLELKKIAAGRYTTNVVCPDGFEMVPDLPNELDVLPNDTVTIDVPLVKPVLVSCRIRTSTDKPISGARISIQHGKNYSSVSAVSDSKGKFEAKVIPGKVVVHVISYRQADYYSREHPRLTFDVSAEEEEQELAPIEVKAKPSQ